MTTLYFADTWFWIALLSKRDNDHARAKKMEKAIPNSIIVTSEMVLTELLNDFASAGEFWRVQCCNFVSRIISNRSVRVVSQSTELFSKSLGIYRTRPDHKWSLTDCSSFVIMGEESITHALTNDRHFAQAGLTLFELN
jgi:predicted nucleic acid-binding protein